MNLPFVLLITINMNSIVFGYYFYNPYNQKLLKSSSKDVPREFIRIRRARQLQQNGIALKRRHRSLGGNCKDAGFVCDAPFDKSATSMFECKSDQYCPNWYKCCDQKCFQHKICVTTIDRPTHDIANCGKWPYECASPYPSAYTKQFRCHSNKQCPTNYRCCPQSCFMHNICIRSETEGGSHQVPIEEIKQRPKSTSSTTTTTSSWINIFGETTTEAENNDDIPTEVIETEATTTTIEPTTTTESTTTESTTTAEPTTTTQTTTTTETTTISETTATTQASTTPEQTEEDDVNEDETTKRDFWETTEAAIAETLDPNDINSVLATEDPDYYDYEGYDEDEDEDE